MVQEFKDFINRGNVVDLAVAVVLATAFAPIVNAVVDGVLMQIVAAVFGEPDFSSLTFDIGDAAIAYGLVITTIINFLFIALAVFFVVKAYNATQTDDDEPTDDESGPSEVDLLIDIRDALAGRP